MYPALCVLCTAAFLAPEKHGIFFDCENDIIQSLDFELLNGGIKWLEKNPTYAERLAAVVEGRGSMNFMAAAKQLSLRLPLETLVRVDAFSMSAGMSRNSMIEQLLQCWNGGGICSSRRGNA